MDIKTLSSQIKTKQLQAEITPDIAKQLLEEGNKRFVENNMINRSHKSFILETINEQYPFAVIFSCIDSRVVPEFIFDQGIGDIFIVRNAGNVVNQDVVGSVEYSCAVVGAKLVVVLAHTSCGAVNSAVNNVELENLTPLLRKIKSLEKDVSKDTANFADELAKVNAIHSVNELLKNSKILKELSDKKEIKIIPAIYQHSTGKVSWL